MTSLLKVESLIKNATQTLCIISRMSSLSGHYALLKEIRHVKCISCETKKVCMPLYRDTKYSTSVMIIQ